jgi:FAD synthetase
VKKKIKVIAFGTFDLLHPGHVYFLEQAKTHGDFLVAAVARDKNVKQAKGRLPVMNETMRLEMVRALKVVDKAVFEDEIKPINTIYAEKPDIVALGYDQTTYMTKDKRDCSHYLKWHGINAEVVRIRPYKNGIYKTTLLRRRLK